jgi:hypothetical protein
LSLSPVGKEGGDGGGSEEAVFGPINSAQVSSVASDLWFGPSLSDILVGSLLYTGHCTCTPPNNTLSCSPKDKPRLGRRMGSLTD